MQSQLIMSAGPYKLISFGNGTAYSLENHCFDSVDDSPLSVFVQGDDAAQFRDEIAAMESAHPTMPTRDVLGEIWATYYQGES